MAVADPALKSDKGIPFLVFEVKRVVFIQLKEIDPVAQTFGAHVLFDFVIKGGANARIAGPGGDAALWQEEGNWEKDEAKKPQFKTAPWYWHNQIDFPNAKEKDVKKV